MNVTGIPGRFVIPVGASRMGIGDTVSIQGDDPDFPGFLQRWKGVVVEVSSISTTIEGRYWIGSEADLATLE